MIGTPAGVTMKEKTKIEKNTNQGKEKRYNLVLFNDDIHTFDYVIESLIDACRMVSIQAEQCTYIAHYKGKCSVRRGSYSELKPMRDRLTERKLMCSID
jgi:ATP-dependent Clp protease adaptor protein ClpS